MPSTTDTNTIAPVHQPRNLPGAKPISSRRLNVLFEEMLRDLAEIFNMPLPGLGSLKTVLDTTNGLRFQDVESVRRLVHGGTGGLEQSDHTKNWRKI